MDAFGNLTQVQEPNPQGGSAYVTSYTYDLLNNLTQVSMPRPTGTQTRTFVYNGPYLMSATNPENGTVSYTYNSIYRVATKTDAKGQQVQYDYDSYGRLTQVHRFVPQNGQLVENTCEEEVYSYDTNPYDSSYSGYYTAGRLTAAQYYLCGSPYVGYTTLTDMYNYSQAGGKTGKRLQVTRPVGSGNSTVNLDGSYTYDNEGRMTAEQYPTANGQAGPNLGYAYDTMGRLNTLTDLTAQSAIISGTTYGPSNELLTMSGLVTETRTYNSMLQLLSLVASASAGPSVNLSYAYSSTQNNGKITSQTDNISGEQVVYTYDALNRLASATATNNSWGQSYSYDGFGNLTGQTVTAGSAPSYSVTPDPSTNHLGGEDANGNTPYSNDANGTNYVMAYDVENRYTGSLTSSGSFMYGYAPGNKRVYRGVENGNNLVTDEVTYWSPAGQKLATYGMVLNGSQYVAVQTGTYYWFGGKLIRNESGYVAADRLGSIGHFYPYGLEKPSATTNGTEKFTGYLRDAETGLDYARNRYHDPGTGRFMTPDPFWGSVKLTVPGTWNRYAYSLSDPINNSDPTGLTCAVLGQRWVDNGAGPGCQSVGTEVSDFGSVNQSSTGLTSVTSTFEPVACPEPCNDTPLDPLGQTVVNGVGTLLNTVSVGAFTYGQTAGTQIGPVEVGTDLVGQYDSSSGVSGGILGETAVGPITVAVENTLSSSGESDGSLLGLLNFLPGTGFQLGIIVSGTNGTLGFYGGTDQAGGGIYFSLGGGVSPSYGTGGGYSGGTGVSDGPQEDEN